MSDLTAIMDLIIQYCTEDEIYSPKRIQNLVHKFCDFFNKSRRQTFFKLLDMRAATVRILKEELELQERQIYLDLEKLVREGFVVKAAPIRMLKKGRPPTIYALPGYNKFEIIEALDRHRVLSTPVYAEVKRITQLILDEYLQDLQRMHTFGEIYTGEVMVIIKKFQRGFRPSDLYNHVLERLRENGVQISQGRGKVHYLSEKLSETLSEAKITQLLKNGTIR